jgi:hypothetical protein
MPGIDLKRRVLPTKIARLMAQRIYGKKISNEAWKNWKLWANCPGRKIWMELDDIAVILAIAAIRSQNRFGELDRQTIARNIPFASQRLALLIKEMDHGLILGKDIPAFIEAYCFTRPSTTMLYRRIPQFSSRTLYEKRLILEAIAA